jgi:cellulose synthase/poly-beta-1,6-N-acetylglucosamine synthase-like glycosyltransferase
VQFCSTLLVPFDEITTEQHLRHHPQDWRLRQTPILLRLKLHCILTWRFFFSISNFVLCLYIYIYIYFFHLLIFYFYSYLYSFYFLFSILSPSL